jgi:2-polyprenyl-3-methyl-5-hydroxy-6-metoxy-1,4-benzoquinol methylase
MTFECIYCKSASCETFHLKDAKDGADLDISTCLNCGLVQLAHVPTDQELSEFYAKVYRAQYRKSDTPKPKHIYRAGKVGKARIDKIAPFVRAGQKHLDIGAGGGEFVYLSSRLGLKSQGIDPASSYLEFGKNAYDIPLEIKEVADIDPQEKFDIITMFHVLEHLAHPTDVVETVHGLLSDSGLFVVEVPNLEAKRTSPTNTYFKAHITYFTNLSLQLLMSSHFTLELIENERVLFAVFRKKTPEQEQATLRAESVALSLQRIRNKTMGEYLRNGGVFSLFRKIRRQYTERRNSTGKSAREILDQF